MCVWCALLCVGHLFHSPFSHVSGNLTEKEAEVRGFGRFCGTGSSGHDRATPELYKSKPVNITAWIREGIMRPLLNKELLAVEGFWQRESQFSPWVCTRVGCPCFRGWSVGFALMDIHVALIRLSGLFKEKNLMTLEVGMVIEIKEELEGSGVDIIRIYYMHV